MLRRRPRKKTLVLVLAAFSVVLITGELIARLGLELGSPVLMQTHPTIEYLAQPNQDARVYGTRQLYNSLSMRSPEPPDDANALRVLVLGDSVINGGRRTDHQHLATTLAADELSEQLGQPVWVGNASAGSWGPGNWRGYLETFGTLNAHAAIIVLSPHDIGDSPAFRPDRGDDLLTHRPVSALAAALSMVAQRVSARLRPDPGPNPNDLNQPGHPVPDPTEARRITAVQDLQAILTSFAEQAIPVAILYFPEADTDARHDATRQRFQQIAEQGQATFVDLGPLLRQSPNALPNPAYRDRMHPSRHGQTLIAQAITRTVTTAIGTGDQSKGSPSATDP